MGKIVSRVCIVAMLATTAVVAQRGGGGVARGGASTGSQPTPLEQLSNRLDLDKKTQVPVVEQIVTDAARAALPVAQEMTQLRRRLLDMEVTGMSADTHPVLDAHAVAAAKMARMEAQAYRDIFATLKPKQQSKTPEAFALMAGILQPATPMAGRAGRGGGGALFEVSAAPVQRGGGGGGSRGGGGFGGGATQPSRLDLLTRAFTLDKTQVKQVKQILDDAYKGAASVCDQLKVTHAAIGAAIQAGKTPADLDELVKAYAVPATAMTRVEMQALAHMLLALSDSQRANTGATDTAFLLARAMFLDDKKWDMAPNGRNY